MNLFGLKRKTDKSKENTNKRKIQIEKLIVELNKIAILRVQNRLERSAALGDDPNYLSVVLFIPFEDAVFKIYTHNKFNPQFDIEVNKNDKWTTVAKYYSLNDNDIMWSPDDDLNLLTKRFLTQFKTLTENEIKQRNAVTG